jgi:23S rRNA-/tRNA-specific pseudouridylate synthase
MDGHYCSCVFRFFQMQLQPVCKADGVRQVRAKPSDNSIEAITNYRVLSSHGSAALVECTPETGRITFRSCVTYFMLDECDTFVL